MEKVFKKLMNEKLRKFQKFDYQKEIEKRKQIEEKQKQKKILKKRQIYI